MAPNVSVVYRLAFSKPSRRIATMRKQLIGLLLAATITTPLALPEAALAQPRHGGQDYRWQGDRNNNWDPSQHYNAGGHHRDRRMGRNDHIYRGRDGRAYCKRSDGTTGLVIGGVAGGLLGNAIGNGSTLGTLLGAGGGALLGRSIDRGDVKCR
jgi:hypothetical protein